MNIESLSPCLTKSFASCLPIEGSSGVLRCELRHADKLRAVYFFADGDQLPGEDQLKSLQESIVAPSYFRSADASRWSHFLVFVAPDARRNQQTFMEQRSAVEGNKDYARKLVLFDSDVDSFIDRSITSAAAGSADSVLGIWIDRLNESGLGAIISEDDRAPLIRSIRAGATLNVSPQKQQKVEPVQPAERPTLSSISISRLGDRRINGEYSLGKVNLIRGPNGSGKTSFLEAIEHYFCGATFRSRGRIEELLATATYRGNATEKPYRQESNTIYQAREQRWYGRTTGRGNNLYVGFSRFNFLNTDAAVDFARDSTQQDLRDALSKIALGSDTTYAWNRIGAFEKDIARELSPIQARIRDLNASISSSEERLIALQSMSPQAEAMTGALRANLSALGFSKHQLDGDIGPDWFSRFSILRDVYVHMASSSNIQNLPNLQKEINALRVDLDTATRLALAKTEFSVAKVVTDGELSSASVYREKLLRIGQYIEVGYAGVSASLIDLEATYAERSMAVLSEADLACIGTVVESFDFVDPTVSQLHNLLISRAEPLRDSLLVLKARRQALEQNIDAENALRTQIQSLARRFAEAATEAHKCPACSTDMAMSELIRRLDLDTGHGDNMDELHSLTDEVYRNEVLLETFTRAQRLLVPIIDDASEMAQQSVSTYINETTDRINSNQKLLAEIVQTRTHIQRLHDGGFSNLEHENLKATLSEARQDAATLQIELSNSILRETELHHKVSSLQKSEQEAAQELSVLCAKYGFWNDISPAEGIARKEQLLSGYRTKLLELPIKAVGMAGEDLPNLTSMLGDLVTNIDQLSELLKLEGARSKETSYITAQVAVARSERERNDSELARLESALDTLRDLQANHSLASGLDSFLAKNLESIRSVFSKIHVPRELTLSGLSECRLIRHGSEKPVDLTEISTGQRSALILSIFLTLNISLQSGPPIVLIDDPVAHVDDMNSLAFLDYLADIGASGLRQIFFATASEKLANLFEKKMEFLGSEFVSFSPCLKAE